MYWHGMDTTTDGPKLGDLLLNPFSWMTVLAGTLSLERATASKGPSYGSETQFVIRILKPAKTVHAKAFNSRQPTLPTLPTFGGV